MKLEEAEVVTLMCLVLLFAKMDSSLSTLVTVKKLYPLRTASTR